MSILLDKFNYSKNNQLKLINMKTLKLNLRSNAKALLLLVTLFGASLIFIQCSKDDTDDCESEVAALQEIFVEKSNTNTSNPTTANCEAEKTAFLNFYNKMIDCGISTTEFDAAMEYYDSVDCGGGGSGTVTVTFWTASSSFGTIYVTLNGQTKSITNYYSSIPSCSATGCATFTVPSGTYSINASANSGATWSGTNTFTSNCTTLELY